MKSLLSVLIISLAFSLGASAQSRSDNTSTERIPSKGLAVFEEGGNFQPYEFTRHAVGDNEIQIDILYTGICHSDLHHVHADWGPEEYPMVPGHEIVGRVVKVGKDVTKFQIGDYAGVGCLINSCGECEFCLAGQEQYCPNVVGTYHDHDQFHNDEYTQGGYSNNIVLVENFAIKVPANADLEKVAPLLCAGITTYSPIHAVNVKAGDKVGIAGFGGLGHMGVQYAVDLGADVTIFDITEEKRADAKRMGATRYVNVNNPSELQGLNNNFDFILSTIPTNYDPNMYLKMLKLNGQLGIVGLPATANTPQIGVDKFVFQGARKMFGSQIGGIKENQEMLDYSVKNNIYPEVTVINPEGTAVDAAYKNVQDGKVKYRYVIDMSKL